MSTRIVPVLLLAAALAGCNGEKICSAGQSVSCVGDAGCLGARVCGADGSGPGECQCAEAGGGGGGGTGGGTAGGSGGGAGGGAAVQCRDVPSGFAGVFHLEPAVLDVTGVPLAHNLQFHADGTYLSSVQGCDFEGFSSGSWAADGGVLVTGSGAVVFSDGGELFAGAGIALLPSTSGTTAWRPGGVCFQGRCDAGALVACEPRLFFADGGPPCPSDGGSPPVPDAGPPPPPVDAG